MHQSSRCKKYQDTGRKLFTALAFVMLNVHRLEAQLVVKLSPETVAAFEAYTRQVESQLNERWNGQKKFLYIEDDPRNEQQVLSGELFIKQMSNGHPIEIKDGLIHDWLGAVYIPNTPVEKVITILEDFDRHAEIYPAVSKSHTLQRDENNVKGYWRLQQKRGLIPVILDVEEDAHYTRLAPGKWKGQNYARSITEVDTSLFTRGRKFPLGEGHGYLWRLYGYWSLESFKSGVLAECRTLSLSRDIPQGLAWAVGPYVQKMPQDSLTSTLKETRNAASQ
ncbi:MAG: hypothetical protein JO210_11725 [Acidobacteriaceae bacterium]|nr:hypothetical protein [Acidobacteriaceae bacterium]